MPQSGQIIPGYLHPHTMTIVNDNTDFTETVADTETGVRTISVFTSSKGRDGVVLKFNNPQKYIEEFGRPNFKLYGQPGYMPFQSLMTGFAESFCMRVMPEDATYSNIVIVAKVSTLAEVAGPPVVPGAITVRFEAVFLPDVASREDFESLIETLTVEEEDVNGYKSFPLFAVYALGRGEYGNGFRFRLNSSPQADKENAFKNYRFEVLELENVVTRKEFFGGTMFADAIEGTSSLFLSDIINDAEGGSSKINMYVLESSFEAIYNEYKLAVPATDVTLDTFDVLTGKDKLGVALPGFVIDANHADAVALDNPDGLPLAGGGEGSFEFNSATPESRETAIDAAYMKAFRGETDASILSKRRTPADLILDAGYSEEVKRELVSLMIRRYDAAGYIDGGILNTLTDAIAWGEAMLGLGDRIFSKEFQHYKVRDPFTGKNMPVTVTYLYASAIPFHYKNFGNQTPFVGEQYARLAGAIKNTLRPVVDADDLDVKEELYGLRLNYFQALAENTYVRGTQGTSQLTWSDLSEENNMHVLLEMKRRLEGMVAGLSYNFAEPEDRKRFTEDADRLFAEYRGTKVREAAVEFSMSPWEEERSILHCNLAVVFRTMAKRAIIEIDVNRRV